MSLKNLALGDDVERPSTDNLGGGFKASSGLYPMIVDVAYAEKTDKGSQAIHIHFKSADKNSNMKYRKTLYVTSGDEKGNLPYYLGGKNKDKKITLPDMQMFEQICKICVPDIKPEDLVEERKTIKLWNYEMKAEVPTEVDALTDLLNKKLLVGLRVVRQNKRAPKEPGSKIYVDTNEPVEFTELHRVFYPDGFSVEEKQAGADSAEFVKTWKAKHTPDYVHDTFKGIGGATPGAPASAAAASAAVEDDLFD